MSSYEEVRNALGEGPARFFPDGGERSFEEQLKALTEEERDCYDTLKRLWIERVKEKQAKGEQSKKNKGIKVFPDSMYLNFARCSPGTKKFDVDNSFRVMKNYDQRYLELNATTLEEQLQTKTLFVIPQLRTKDSHDVFYMKPSRYWPQKTSTKEIIDNLAYCMTTMVASKEKNSKEGIAFLANMDDWSFSNFSISYCHNFMMMLQGKIPVRVRLFLIVNPPSWFGKIWSIMKPMLSSEFRKKVHMIPENKLGDFLMNGYENYLPDDLTTGKASTDEMVKDFIAYRKFMEKEES